MRKRRAVLVAAVALLAVGLQGRAHGNALLVEAAQGVDVAAEGVALAATPSVTYSAGWNMISMPVVPANPAFNALFSDAISAFKFAGSYQQVTNLSECEGYWLNLSTGGTYTLAGTGVNQCNRSWPLSWSMVGVPISGLAASDIAQTPTGNIISIFAFAGSYQQISLTTGVLDQGDGYWFNLTQAGQLVMDADTPAAKPVAGALPGEVALEGSKLVVKASGSRQALALGAQVSEMVELPPLPPAGVLDARALVGGVPTAQVPVADRLTDYRLQLQGSDMQLEWDIEPAEANQWQLVINGQAYPLAGLGSLSFSEAPANASLRYTPLPAQFSLAANYPNPFNPSTTIQYTLPAAVDVELTVYDVLGQTIRRLVNERQMPGSYGVVWDARNARGNEVANGVYFYELRAGDFHAIRRMLLAK